MAGLQPKKGIKFEIKVAAYFLTKKYSFGPLDLDLRDPVEFDIYLLRFPKEYSSFDIDVDLDIYFKSKNNIQFLFECKAGDKLTIGFKSKEFIDALSKFFALKKYCDTEKKRGFPVQFVFATNIDPKRISDFIENPLQDDLKYVKSKLIKELRKKGAKVTQSSISIDELNTFVRSIFLIYLPDKKLETVEDANKFQQNIQRVLDRHQKKEYIIHGVKQYFSIEERLDVYFGAINNLETEDLETIKVEKIMNIYIGFDAELDGIIDTIRQEIKPDVACIELSLNKFNLAVKIINRKLNALDVYKPLTEFINNHLLGYRFLIYSDLTNFLLYDPTLIAKMVSASRFFVKDGFDLNKIKNKINLELTDSVLVRIAIDSYAVVKGHRLSPRKFLHDVS